MPKVKQGAARHRKHKRILRNARGYWGGRSTLYRTAMEAVARAQKQATIHRRQKKRDFRRLWIVRINAACRQLGITYSQFVRGLKEAKIDLNRKMLADLAVHDSNGFAELVARARAALSSTS